MKTKRKWERVFVEWIDSSRFTQPWWNIEEFIKETKEYSIMTSVGYLFHEDKHFVYLATSIHWQDGKDIVQIGNITNIPKGCILKKQKI